MGKQGYKVREGEKPYTILKPIYQEYDKDGTGKGSIIGYNKVPVYDISQVESNINDKQLSMKDLSYFSADQLSELIDVARKKKICLRRNVRNLVYTDMHCFKECRDRTN